MLCHRNHAWPRKYMLAFRVFAIRKTAGSQAMAWTFYGIFCGRDGGGFYRIFFGNDFERLCEIFGVHRRGVFDFPRHKNAPTKLFFGKRRDEKTGIFYRAFRKPDQRESHLGLHHRAHVFCLAIQSRFSRCIGGGIFPSVYRSALQSSLAFCRSFFAKIFHRAHENHKHRDGAFAFALRAQPDSHVIFFHENANFILQNSKGVV